MKKSVRYFYLFVFSIANSYIISTSAQTLHWQKLTADIYVYDILYDGEQNLYFCGSQGDRFFWRSTDLGINWTRLGNGSLSLYRITIDSNGTLWSGNSVTGGIFKSTNQGDTWTISLSSTDKILSLTVSPNNWIWAGTLDGKIIFSSDNGNTWVANQVYSEQFWSIASNGLNHLFAGDTDGNIYRSTNLGSDWELVYDGELWINGLVIDDSNHIYANDWDTRLISKDNGTTWSQIEGLGLGRLFIDKYHNFYSEYGYRSMDNCSTWTFIGPVSADSYVFIDSLVFAGTTDGVFLHDPSFQSYIGSNYFPLALGNKWQFNRRCNNSFAGNTMYSIVRDTIILNQRYFLIQGDVNDWVRYDQTENKLFLRWNDSDYVVMDYTLNEGSVFENISFNTHGIINVTVVAPVFISIFDSVYHSKGYYHANGGVGFYWSSHSYYSEKLGETKVETNFSVIGGNSEDCVRKMIRAILFDSSGFRYYSDHSKPIINFQPVFITNNFSLNWNFGVDHYHSKFNNTWNENFVDTVKLFSFYSDGDSTITNAPVLATNLPNSINYNYSFILDSTLMKSSYKFYYKITAVDKGIVPESTIKPDTGYYELIYDPNPVSVDPIKNTINTFSLEQNYPNPFNPETRIKFTIPSNVYGETSNVKLTVFDILGNEIATLVNEEKPAGNYEVTFNADGLSSGMYFYKLQAGNFSKIKKMMILK